MPEVQPPANPAMSREDIAFFINAIWSSFLAPEWLRDDLIELGKAVYAKTTLAKLDDKKFAQLLPFLTKMAESMGTKLHVKVLELSQPLLDDNARLQADLTKVEAERNSLASTLEATKKNASAMIAPLVVPTTEVKPPAPEAKPAAPEAKSAAPETKPAAPETNPIVPKAKVIEPTSESKVIEPTTEPAMTEVPPATPSSESTQTDTRPTPDQPEKPNG